jgi:hypothetical protein
VIVSSNKITTLLAVYLLSINLISIIMAQKDAFKVTAVTAKGKEHSMNLEKIKGARKEEHVVYLGNISTHCWAIWNPQCFFTPIKNFYHELVRKRMV